MTFDEIIEIAAKRIASETSWIKVENAFEPKSLDRHMLRDNFEGTVALLVSSIETADPMQVSKILLAIQEEMLYRAIRKHQDASE